MSTKFGDLYRKVSVKTKKFPKTLDKSSILGYNIKRRILCNSREVLK